jgi:hypothetical protein
VRNESGAHALHQLVSAFDGHPGQAALVGDFFVEHLDGVADERRTAVARSELFF